MCGWFGPFQQEKQLTFTILLTDPRPNFRERLAANLYRLARPAEVIEFGDSLYRFSVGMGRVQEITDALAADISPWGAIVEITEQGT